MTDSSQPRILPDASVIRDRYETIKSLYVDEFCLGIGEKLSKDLYLSKELLHCAVNAYFDDIYKYKAYAGSEYANSYKQAAYTMIWISRFKPIQIKETAKIESTFLTINESFAIFAGLTFLSPVVTDKMSKNFYNHLIYTLTYRNVTGRLLATILSLMEKAALGGVKF